MFSYAYSGPVIEPCGFARRTHNKTSHSYTYRDAEEGFCNSTRATPHGGAAPLGAYAQGRLRFVRGSDVSNVLPRGAAQLQSKTDWTLTFRECFADVSNVLTRGASRLSKVCEHDVVTRGMGGGG